jgi:hypothetical protein
MRLTFSGENVINVADKINKLGESKFAHLVYFD